MKIGDIVEFKKTKNRYRIAGFGRMKDPNGSKWSDAVIYETYMDYDPDEGDYTKASTIDVFIREKTDFDEKFEISIPMVQIYNSETGQPVYEFGVSERLLKEYFDLGFGGGKSIKASTKDPKVSIDVWCQTLAGDIVIGGMKTADERLTQEVLEKIRKDMEEKKFGENIVALSQIQMLVFFLTIPIDDSSEEKQEESKSETEESDPEKDSENNETLG